MTILRLGDRYINLDNLIMTSNINSTTVALLFIGGEKFEVIGVENIQKLYETLEKFRIKPNESR